MATVFMMFSGDNLNLIMQFLGGPSVFAAVVGDACQKRTTDENLAVIEVIKTLYIGVLGRLPAPHVRFNEEDTNFLQSIVIEVSRWPIFRDQCVQNALCNLLTSNDPQRYVDDQNAVLRHLWSRIVSAKTRSATLKRKLANIGPLCRLRATCTRFRRYIFPSLNVEFQ